MMTGTLLIPTSAAITAAPGGDVAADAPGVIDQQLQQSRNGNCHAALPLRCPRCDSTKTKFCYYNNYSLSQPRHFCKACKRYWTRGGTLRNVPIGGGCRKNKRVKKPTPTPTPSSSSSPTSSISLLPTLNQQSTNGGCPDLNPLLYGLTAAAASDVNLGLLGMQIYDFQPQMNPLGLSYNSSEPHNEEEYHSGFTHQLQPSSSTAAAFLNDYSDLFASSAAGAASLLVSSLKQPTRTDDYGHTFLSYEPQHSTISTDLDALKEVKIEDEAANVISNSSLMSWQLAFDNNSYDAIATATATTIVPAEASSFYWNNPATGAAAWPDTANCGSSLAPLF